MKRILAIVLALSMLLAVGLMAGCGDTDVTTTPSQSTPAGTTGGDKEPAATTGGSEPAATTAGGSDETTASQGGEQTSATDPGTVEDPFANYNGETKVPGFEDIDFRNTEFVIASSNVDAEFSRMPCADIFSEETDAISVAVRKRNDFVEKLYNCKITMKEHENPGSLATADVTGNAHTIDVYGAPYTHSSTNTNSLNVLSLDIDFTNDWWDQKYVQSLAAKNSDGVMVLGHLMGDFCVYGMSCLYMLAFDKDVYESAGIESQFGSIYDLVRENKWTMDVFTEMYKSVVKENSGDSTLKTEDGDILGWCTTNYAPHALHVASGLEIISTVDGVMTFQMADHQAEWIDVVDKAIEIWKMPEHENSGYGRIRDLVPAHQTLFFSEVIDVLARWKDQQDLKIGVVPYPKYTESQEGYYNYVDSHLVVYAVPKSVPDVQVIADFLEVFTAHSKYIVRTAWVDAYCYEYCGDMDSAEMLEIILDSRTYDPGYHIFSQNTENEISSWITTGTNHFTKWLGRNTETVKSKIAENVAARMKAD